MEFLTPPPSAIVIENNEYYVSRRELDSVKFKLAKKFVNFLRLVGMCDPDSMYQVLRYRWKARKRERSGPPANGEIILERKQIKHGWPVVLLAIYFLLTIKFIVWLVYQFKYDATTLRLQQLRDKLMANQSIGVIGGGGVSLEQDGLCHIYGATSGECQHEQELRESIASSYSIMKQLGNPYVNIGFSMQPAILLSLGVVYLTYFHPQLILNFGSKHELFLVDLLLDERKEFMKCEALIEREVQLVENSSRNCIEAASQLAFNELARASHKCLLEPDLVESVDAKARQLAEMGAARCVSDHKLLVRELRRLVAGKQLHPINRTSPEWRAEIVTNFVKACVGNLVYSFVLDWTLIYFAHLISPIDLEFVTTMDVFVMFEVWFYFQLSVITITYHVATFMLHCANQTRYIDHVRGRVRKLIVENERQFVALLKAHDSWDENYAKMNFKLVQTFLEYRVFIGQLIVFVTNMADIVSVCLLIIFITPVFARLYAPYIINDYKAAGSVYSLNLTLFADILLVPICCFFYKGQQLYRAMSSLLAHAVELNQQARKRFNGRPIYMENTVAMIRKELNDPEKMMGHFLTSVPGFQATFPRLLEVHFYCSVLNLALYCEIDAWKKLLGQRFDDPFLLMI